MEHHFFLKKTFEIAWKNAEAGLDPFAALLVKDEEIKASSADQSIRYSDPTAHAELVLISEYCRTNKLIALKEYTLYANVEPCLMCCGAIHWAKVKTVVFSVPQSRLQKTSGGTPKPSSRDFLSIGGKKIEVIGPLLEQEGIKVLDAFPWKSKKERHLQFWA